jgi:uncharacterized membrane protein (DUF4010 family)
MIIFLSIKESFYDIIIKKRVVMFATLNISIIFQFLMVVIFSFLTGLELREYIYSKQKPLVIGTTRTFTFIGLLGFVLKIISLNLFIVGFIIISLFFLLFYIYKLQNQQTGIIQIVTSLLTYSYGALITLSVFYIPLIYVAIVFIISSKKQISLLMQKIDNEELITFSKFLILSVIILPILPKDDVIPYVSISPFKIWIAVVVVSSISYASYILQKYFLKSAGIVVTAVLGGIYSSTATTVVLAKKSLNSLVEGSIVLATGVMYLRLLAIIAIFNFNLAQNLLIPFISLFLISLVMFIFFKERGSDENTDFNSNPLELQVAFIFAGLFILMAAITQFVTTHFGNLGLQILSAIVGFTDIDPFILSLIQGEYSVTTHDLIQAILVAVASNNILKALYAMSFSNWKMKKAMWGLLFLAVSTLLWVLYFY